MTAKNIYQTNTDRATADENTTGKAITENKTATGKPTASKQGQRKPESELRAAARRHGLTLGELADKMGISYRYLSQLSTSYRPWSPAMKAMVMAVLGEVLGQSVVYRQGGRVSGESACIRERARKTGMSMGELAEKAECPGATCRRWPGAIGTWG